MGLRKYIRDNKIIIVVLIFLLAFFSLNYAKPAFMYNENGTTKQFGVGYKRRTVLPLWLIVIFLSILSYMFIMYYLAYSY
jgi:hypothetical protein